MELNKIMSILKEAGTICILPHVSADGDALGSCLALGLALRKLSKSVDIVLEEKIPYIYDFLPGREMTRVYGNDSGTYDVVVALDTGDMGRLGKRAPLFEAAGITVNIDHHRTNSGFGFYNYVHTASSAVGEIVYRMIKKMGIDMDLDIATCLYVAITTDTGGFRFGNTTAVTHQIAGELINKGVQVAEISQRVFDAMSLEKLRLMGNAINTLELLEDGRVAYITVTDEIMQKVGAADEDCDGIVNLGRNVNGVEVAVMFRQKDSGEIKLNFRSKAYVDVSAIAAAYGGGGHIRAAGCTVMEPLDAIKPRLLEDIRKALKPKKIHSVHES